jgi:hypothetical protein
MYQSKPLYEIVEKEGCKYQASQNIKNHIQAGMASNARRLHSGINLPPTIDDLPNPLGVAQGFKALPYWETFPTKAPLPIDLLPPPFLYGHNPDQILADIWTIKNTQVKGLIAPSIVEHLTQIMPHNIWSSDGKVNNVLENYLNAFMSNITSGTKENYTALLLLQAGVSTYQHLLYKEDDYTEDELNKIFWTIFKTMLQNNE